MVLDHWVFKTPVKVPLCTGWWTSGFPIQDCDHAQHETWGFDRRKAVTFLRERSWISHPTDLNIFAATDSRNGKTFTFCYGKIHHFSYEKILVISMAMASIAMAMLVSTRKKMFRKLDSELRGRLSIWPPPSSSQIWAHGAHGVSTSASSWAIFNHKLGQISVPELIPHYIQTQRQGFIAISETNPSSSCLAGSALKCEDIIADHHPISMVEHKIYCKATMAMVLDDFPTQTQFYKGFFPLITSMKTMIFPITTPQTPWLSLQKPTNTMIFPLKNSQKPWFSL